MLGQFIRWCIMYWLHLKTACTVNSKRYCWWVKALYVLSGPCRPKNETLVVTNSQPPTSPPITQCKALLPYKLPVPIYLPRMDG